MNQSLLRRLDFFAFLPLVVFLATVQWHSVKFPDRWVYAYLYTLAPAVVFSALVFINFRACSKLWLGSNLWFALLGIFALFRAWVPLEFLGAGFQESGGFITTACIGIVSSFFAPGSFVGAPSSDRGIARRFDWMLTLIAIGGAIVLYLNQGNRIISISIPVLGFLIGLYIIGRRLEVLRKF
jgi:hypothetical protein